MENRPAAFRFPVTLSARLAVDVNIRRPLDFGEERYWLVN
jgi:hypothetical protein